MNLQFILLDVELNISRLENLGLKLDCIERISVKLIFFMNSFDEISKFLVSPFQWYIFKSQVVRFSLVKFLLVFSVRNIVRNVSMIRIVF